MMKRASLCLLLLALLGSSACTIQLEKKVVDAQGGGSDTVANVDLAQVEIEGDVGVDPDLSECAGDPVCKRAGVCVQLSEEAIPECVDGVWTCDYSDVAGYEEEERSCDGLDNDCDGLTDEALEDIADSDCSREGICGGEAARAQCAQGRWLCDYSGVAGWQAVEQRCDGVDNDCDGETDEDLVDTAPDAGVCPELGVCAGFGLYAVCVQGDWQCAPERLLPDYEAIEASCDGLDNDCDGETDEDLVAPEGEECLGVGVCASLGAGGAVACIDGAWGCDYSRVPAYEAVEVSCDGLDNDCDGTTDGADEVVADPAPARDAACESAKGVCREGQAMCQGGGWVCDFSAVAGYQPVVETLCDNLDNDCDGLTDEGIELEGAAVIATGCPAQGVCADDPRAICRGGRWLCDPSGSAGYEGVELSCDNLDNDCDGSTDEGLSDVAQSDCLKVGACAGAVEAACVAGGWICDYRGVAHYEPVERSCDGIDNDCDGQTDEGLAGVWPEECARLGVCGQAQPTCVGGQWRCNLDSLATYQLPGQETLCDNLDNDCDGYTDVDRQGRPLADLVDAGCSLLGQCAGGGVVASCSAGRWSCDYSGVSFFEQRETLCDNRDNDCDGLTDEDLSDPALAGCPNLGECRGRVEAVCNGAAGFSCDFSGVVDYEAVETLCDRRDNDCDGLTDENLSEATSQTPCLDIGLCAVGVPAECTPQGWLCHYDQLPDYEEIETLCDGIDNDCDGETDVGVCTGPGAPCTSSAGCDSGLCYDDIDGEGKFCAAAVDNCVYAWDNRIASQALDGESVCEDSSSFLLCEAGVWAASALCPPVTPYCLAEVDGACHECLPGTIACDGADVLTCDADGDGYSVASSCAAGRFCAGDGDCFSGAEVLPSGDATGGQSDVSVACQSGQGYWVAGWATDGNVFLRRLSPPESALVGNRTQANANGAGQCAEPVVGTFPNGAILMAWSRGDDVYLRRFLAGGFPLETPEILVNTTSAGVQGAPRVAGYNNAGDVPSGEVVVVFESEGDLFFRRFPQSQNNPPLDATQQPINLETGAARVSPDVAAHEGGAFAVVWTSPGGFGGGDEIRMRVFGADGSGGAELVLSDDTAEDESNPRVAAVPGGGYLVTWEGADADGRGVFARRFDSAGTPLGATASLPLSAAGEQSAPALAVSADGTRAVFLWEDDGVDGDGVGIALRGATLDGAGMTLDAQVRTHNASVAGDQIGPAAAFCGTTFLGGYESVPNTAVYVRQGR